MFDVCLIFTQLRSQKSIFLCLSIFLENGRRGFFIDCQQFFFINIVVSCVVLTLLRIATWLLKIKAIKIKLKSKFYSNQIRISQTSWIRFIVKGCSFKSIWPDHSAPKIQTYLSEMRKIRFWSKSIQMQIAGKWRFVPSLRAKEVLRMLLFKISFFCSWPIILHKM